MPVPRADADERWAAMLAGWAIPEVLVASAPASPYFFDPRVFIAAADEAIRREHDSPSDAVARDALPAGGSVVDVGAGAGAASLRLGAGHVTAVDTNRELLDAFLERAATQEVAASAIEGRWPDVGPTTPVADVVVCHHVFYNVADLRPFAGALSSHARRRVVVELTAVHPMAWMAPYWEAMHGLSQPDGPTADDAVAVLEDLGLVVRQQRWDRPVQMIGESDVDGVRRIARRLCLAEDRLDELRHVVEATPPPTSRGVVTLWWEPPVSR